MTLSDFSIKRPVFAWMLMAALIIFGYLGFSKMGISQMPDVDFPVVTVTMTWEGASPEVMETEVTDVIEDAVMQVEGVKEVTSSSRDGSTQVTVEFNLGRNIDAAVQDVQSRISQAQKNLPKDADPPIITKTNPEDQPIIWLSLSGTRDLHFMMEYAYNELKDEFTTVQGVGDIILGGYVDPNLRVWLDAKKMADRELTVSDVTDAITSQHAEVPAGYIDTGVKELNVRVMGEAASVQEFKNLVIPGRAGAPIWRKFRIGDVAEVEDGLADIRRISRVNGQPAIGIGIRKQRGANEVAVAKAVKAKLAQVIPTLPKGLTMAVNFDRSKFVEQSTHELNMHLMMAGVLTSLVCWLFLGSISAAFNIVLAIPTSILGAFIFMQWLGFTLNTFTLLGLTLVIGIVVDDAIMVLENIVRHREEGQSRIKGAIMGAREITGAAMAATLAILAIFVPIVFMRGIVGKFFFQFGMTISLAVALSLLEALTLAPMRCSQFLNIGNHSFIARGMDRLMDGMTNVYKRGLVWCLNHRWLVVLTSVVIFVLSLRIAGFLKKEFVPAQDQSTLLVRLQTPIGSSIEFTDSVFKEAEKFVLSRPEVDHYYAAIGGFGGGEVNSGMMFLTLKDKKNRPVDPKAGHPLSQQELVPVFRKGLNSLPGVDRAIIQDLSQAGFTAKRGFPIEFTLVGPDWDKLGQLSEVFRKKMNESGYMVDADSDYELGQPELRVYPDREKAAERGVSVSEIGNTINAMIGGVRVGKYTRAGRRYDIRVRLAQGDRSRPQDISKIFVRNNRGEVIRLSDVVQVKDQQTLLSINRKNRERAINMYANPAPGKSQGEALQKVRAMAKEILPDGYRADFTGSAETYNESFSSLNLALALGILVAYMVLASQYNSFIHPLAVLMALPFSVTGAFIALWLTHKSLNLYSMIGLILLMGIVKKNSILLVDFTNQARARGRPLRQSIEEASPVRLRPIIMTSIATITAAIPPALALGSGSEVTQPMAIVIIGGVTVSTFLTLYVVPCAYSLMARLESHSHDEDLNEALVELGEKERSPAV